MPTLSDVAFPASVEALRLAKDLNAELCNAENSYLVNNLPILPFRRAYLDTLRALLTASLYAASVTVTPSTT